jgi:hypothetical protein
MKTKMFPLTVLASCLAVHAADIEITSLASNGRLTWTNSFTNGLFSIEWAPALGTNWHNDWNLLQNFWVSSRTNTVDVPMLYRVKCTTNLLTPWPAGVLFGYSVSNAVSNVWTQRVRLLSYVTPLLGAPLPGAGTEYALFEAIDSRGSMGLGLLRSTDSASISFDTCSLAEVLNWQLGPVGSTWTNFNYKCQYTRKVTIDAIETITVGAGTFTSCYKFHKQILSGSSAPRPELYEWVKPGIGLVKWVDYWTDNGPDVYELQWWTVPTP